MEQLNRLPDKQLARFLQAQETIYSTVMEELRGGKKRSHWMWFIFPQITGLGHSSTSRYYAIENLEEARAYLNNPTLGKRLRECAQLVFEIDNHSITEIFGYPDDRKLSSSMTLFDVVAEEGSIFSQVLDKYFNGKRDKATLEIINILKGNN